MGPREMRIESGEGFTSRRPRRRWQANIRMDLKKIGINMGN